MKNSLETIAINFISSKDVEARVMHSRSDNVKYTSYNDVNEVVDELFESLRSRYQVNLETSMRGRDCIFDSVQLMYQKCLKVNYRRGSSYIDFPDWIKKKKPTINLKNTNKKCFHYAATVSSNYKKIKSNLERVSNI